MGLALLCKPLVGLVFVPVVAAWMVWIGETRRTAWLLGTAAVALAVAAPWHVSMALEHGREFWGRYFGAEIVDRATGVLQAGHDEPMPWWFYLHQLALRGWPWLAFVVLALVRRWRGGLEVDRRGWRLAVVWTGAWLVLLSVFADRRDRYAIPYQPGLAMLSAAWLAHPAGAAGARAVRWGLRWGAVIVCVVGGVIAALPIKVQGGPDPQWPTLYAWMRERGLEKPGSVWGGAFSGPHGARVYLEFGWWPTPMRDAHGREIARPPAGAHVVYESHDGAGPGPGEEKVFESGSVAVTRMK